MANKVEAYILDEKTGKYVLNPNFKAEEAAAPAAEEKKSKAGRPAKAKK